MVLLHFLRCLLPHHYLLLLLPSMASMIPQNLFSFFSHHLHRNYHSLMVSFPLPSLVPLSSLLLPLHFLLNHYNSSFSSLSLQQVPWNFLVDPLMPVSLHPMHLTYATTNFLLLFSRLLPFAPPRFSLHYPFLAHLLAECLMEEEEEVKVAGITSRQHRV